MTDTLSAYLTSGHITRALDRERVAQNERTWRESFGHPSHRLMVAAHEMAVAEFYGRGKPTTTPGTPAQLAELVDAVTGYRPAKKYSPKTKPARITAERQLQIAVEAATRKAS